MRHVLNAFVVAFVTTACFCMQAIGVELNSLEELSTTYLRVGETVGLPQLADGSKYVVMDIRTGVVEDNGVVIRALEPGYSKVAVATLDEATSTYVVDDTQVARLVVIPEVEGDGQVYLLDIVAFQINWSAASWINITNPDAPRSYPQNIDDVAIIARNGPTITQLDVDVTLGELYLAHNTNKDNDNVAIVLCNTGSSSHTITFKRSSGTPGLMKLTGLSRTDYENVIRGPQFALGHNGKSDYPLNIEMPDGLVIDAGKHPDYKDTSLRDSYNRSRIRFDAVSFNIPENKKLKIINTNHFNSNTSNNTWPLDSYANYYFNEYASVVGSGTFEYDGAAPISITDTFVNFDGKVIVKNKPHYDNVGINSLGGGMWLGETGDGYPTNTTLIIEGSVSNVLDIESGVLGRVSLSYSMLSTPVENVLPRKEIVLHGGSLNYATGKKGWALSTITNRTESLVVSNGFSMVKMSSSLNLPTNRLEIGRISNANRGTLFVQSDAFKNLGKYCEFVIENYNEHAIGAGGSYADRKESIIPWMFCYGNGDGKVPMFPAIDEDNKLVWTYNYTKPFEAGYNYYIGTGAIQIKNNMEANSCITHVPIRIASMNYNNKVITIHSGAFAAIGGIQMNEVSMYLNGGRATLDFPNPVYFYCMSSTPEAPAKMLMNITAPQGIAFSGNGCIAIGGDQKGIDEEIAINNLHVKLGVVDSETSSNIPAEIDVPVRMEGFGSILQIDVAGSLCNQELHLNDHANEGPKVIPLADTTESVAKLYINGKTMNRGTYGSSESAAEFVDDEHFIGTGMIDVRSDDGVYMTIIVIK